ncbi:ubiquitin-conjugating enzyme/RWD-like protein [Trichophaea hybrida]|nr:ubiquitin-conjugating enzyme/RWD-like protein [Trichophaea hybrida]
MASSDAPPAYNKKSPTIKRILREAADLASSPSPDYHAAPLETDLFEWHFTFRGPPETPYAQGIYHGRINLPPTYPMRPPSFRFLSPSGRFEVNREICLSISGHHEDTWQPAWGVRTAVVALRGFMETEPGGQVGALECSEEQRRVMAKESREWRCETCGKSSVKILEESEEAAREMGLEGRVEEETPTELKIGFKVKKEEEEGEGQSSAMTVEPTPTPTTTQPSPPIQQFQAPMPAVANGYVPPPGQPVAANGYVSPPALHPLGQPVNGVPAHLQGLLPPYLDPQFAPAPQQQPPPRREETFWIDRLIVLLAVALAAVVLRRLVASSSMY